MKRYPRVDGLPTGPDTLMELCGGDVALVCRIQADVKERVMTDEAGAEGENPRSTFFIGDSDLVLLGMAAGVAARWQMLRKGGSIRLAGFPQDDAHAIELVKQGIALAEAIPLDDIPELTIIVKGDRAAVQRLRTLSSSDGIIYED